MTGLVLQDISLTARIESFVEYSKTFGSSYKAFFGEVRISNFCRELVSSELLLGASETAYRRNVRVMRLTCHYPETVELVEKVYNDSVAGHSAVGKDRLGIKHTDSALLLHSKRRMFYISSTLSQFIQENVQKTK